MIMNSQKNIPETINIELTTKCPLHCPQCYCTLESGKDINLDTAVKWIKEGSEMGVEAVMLSGGETMCYPYLYEIIRVVKEHKMIANAAFSGYKFTQKTFDKLVDSGVDGIFISLNDSTKEINSMSRDGYELAIPALELLQKNSYKNTTINWVMHSSNANDFENMVKLAEKYEVSNLTVMAVKPDSNNNLNTIPSKKQMETVKKVFKSYKGSVKLYVESCFSPMLALICDTKLFGNFNIGKHYGCGAGISAFSVNVDGFLSPCRHLDYFEKYDFLKEYWNNSPILKHLRELDKNKREPCVSCYYSNYCRHCISINSKLNNELYIGNEYCNLYEKIKYK